MTSSVDTQAAPAGNGRRRLRRPTGRSVFLGIVLVVIAVYTQMGFDLEWRTQAGRIGPGYFPRIIGILAIVCTLAALVISLRPGATDDEEDLADEEAGEADLGRHPRVLVLVVAASAVFVALFESLGAIVSGALYLAAVLFLLNRGHRVTNVVIAIALPVLLYLLFQSFLNAGLPNGLLPRF